MRWANFLHIYQPPTQKEVWIRRITEESYRKIFSGLLNIPQARISLNINGVLCEFLEQYSGRDVLDNIKTLVERGHIELTGSAKYHPFLPLLPTTEIERQILLNEETLNKYFGLSWKKGGFFSPEMAYSRKVAEAAKKLGYRWIIADELGFPSAKGPSPEKTYAIKGLDDFFVFFRDRNFSFAIASAQIGTIPAVLRYLGDRIKVEHNYIITAMDGETFGHHRPGLEQLLFDLMKTPEIQSVMISDLIDYFPSLEIIEPKESTWAATKKDLQRHTPFSRWYGQDNIIQQKQWQLTNLAVDLISRSPADAEGRTMLDKALHSDQYWWSSARPWWSMEMIERGAHELREIVWRSPTATEEEKQKAVNLYRDIVFTGFQWQRSGLVDEIARHENEEMLGIMEQKQSFYVTREEYKQVITALKEQMRLAAKSEDYHRAAMIKDRIRELNEEMEKAKS